MLIFLGPVALVTAGGELESEAAGAGYYRHHKLARPLQESRQELLTGFKYLSMASPIFAIFT